MYGCAPGLCYLGRIMCPQFSSDCANEQEQKVLTYISNGFALPCLHAYGPFLLPIPSVHFRGAMLHGGRTKSFAPFADVSFQLNIASSVFPICMTSFSYWVFNLLLGMLLPIQHVKPHMTC